LERCQNGLQLDKVLLRHNIKKGSLLIIFPPTVEWTSKRNRFWPFRDICTLFWCSKLIRPLVFWICHLSCFESCDCRFQCAFTACLCVFKEITLVGSSQRNYFENTTACSKRTLKTTVATQLKLRYFACIFIKLPT